MRLDDKYNSIIHPPQPVKHIAPAPIAVEPPRVRRPVVTNANQDPNTAEGIVVTSIPVEPPRKYSGYYSPTRELYSEEPRYKCPIVQTRLGLRYLC